MARTTIFDFFGLSRELRDQIYGELLDKDITLHLKGCLQVLVKNGPSLALMLVSHQFGSEYQEAVERCSTLVCMDMREGSPSGVKVPTLSAVFRSIRRLELRPWLLCEDDHEFPTPLKECNAVREIKAHQDWVAKIIDQMQSPAAHLLVGMEDCGVRCTENCMPEISKLTKVRGFAKLVVKDAGSAGGGRDRVNLTYNDGTQQIESVGNREDGQSMFEEDFGFFKESEVDPGTYPDSEDTDKDDGKGNASSGDYTEDESVEEDEGDEDEEED